MKISTKAIVQTGLLLAICIASQFMKNLSVYITGPIVNITIVMAVLLIGVSSGIILAVISPLTAFWISPSPITMGIPVIIPCIMIGNVLLAVGIWVFQKKMLREKLKLNLRVASIVLVFLPMYSSNINVPEKKLNILLDTAKVTFSVTQFITAIIGCAISYVIWLRIKGVVNKE